MKKDQKALVSFLTKTSKTEVERVRALVRWVGDNIAYDTRFAAARGADADQSAAAVLLRGTAVCQGYANLVKQLARCYGAREFNSNILLISEFSISTSASPKSSVE